MTPTPMRRVLVMALLFVVLVGVVVADRLVDKEPVSVRTLPGANGPEATAASALSSSWYCPGGSANGGPVDLQVTVMNPTDSPLRGTMTVFPVGAERVVRPIEVAPSSGLHTFVKDVVQAGWAAVLVDLDGGGAAVDQTVGSASDIEATPCSSSASSTWYFPSGSTQKDAVLTLLVFNPFPDDAVVDLAFATGEGRRVPGDFVGLLVPAGSLLPIDVGAHVRRQDFVSTEVKARAGRVVAGQAMVRTGPGIAGVSATLGAPSLGDTWMFPDGLVTDAVAERLEFYNPGGDEARVDVEVALQEGEAEPFEVTVPPQGRFTLDVRAESRVPKGVPHAFLAQSVNGVPVAVARVIESAGPRVGRSDMLGGRRLARSWGLANGAASEIRDEWAIVYNPTESDSTVSVTALADGQRVAVEGLQGVNVPAGRRVALRLTDHIKRLPLTLLVTASGDVSVERALYGQPSLSTSIAIPLG